MAREVSDPVGQAVVRWRSTAQGGRHSGPPSGPVYTPTAVFVLGGEEEVQPGWPASADPYVSVIVELIRLFEDGSWLCKIDFLARDIAAPYVHAGGRFLLMEGARPVADGEFTEVYRDRLG